MQHRQLSPKEVGKLIKNFHKAQKKVVEELTKLDRWINTADHRGITHDDLTQAKNQRAEFNRQASLAVPKKPTEIIKATEILRSTSYDIGFCSKDIEELFKSNSTPPATGSDQGESTLSTRSNSSSSPEMTGVPSPTSIQFTPV